jgi:hypothetical protein
MDKHIADHGATTDGYLFQGRRKKLVVRRTYQVLPDVRGVHEGVIDEGIGGRAKASPGR